MPPLTHTLTGSVAAGRFTVIALAGSLAGVTARALATELTDVAAAAFAAWPWNEGLAHARQLTNRLLADAARPGYTLAFAFTGGGPGLAGFGYGVPRHPWAGASVTGLEVDGAEPFELCELAVRPLARGQGAGRALQDAIVDASGPQLRWLVTHPAAYPAIGLYRATGWRCRRRFTSRTGDARLLMTRSS